VTVLRRLPRWARWALLAANLAGSIGVLAAWWQAIWPNLAAAWTQASALLTLAPPAMAWLARVLDAHHEHTRVQVERQISARADAHSERLSAVSDQIAALHAKFDQQRGGTQ